MERSGRRGWRRCGRYFLLIGILSCQLLPCFLAYANGNGTITGTVFHDFNSDGVFNTTSSGALPAVDVHLAGVTVSAYDSVGALQGTTTTVRCTGAAVPSAFCTGADTGPNYKSWLCNR